VDGEFNGGWAPLLQWRCQAQHPATFALIYRPARLPCLFYGDELGMGDWPGLRDARRPTGTPMRLERGPNGGFSSSFPDPLLLLDGRSPHPVLSLPRVNGGVQQQLSAPLNWHHRNAHQSRFSYPALRYGDNW